MRPSQFARMLTLSMPLACCGLHTPSQAGAATSSPMPALNSPFEGLVIPHARARNYRCPSPPSPYTGALVFRSKYEGSGRSRDTLNSDAQRAYQLATAPVQALERGLSELSDRFVQGDGNAAICGVAWLRHWARANALMGEANMTGKAVRKWALAAIAFNLLKIQHAHGLNPADLIEVRAWLAELAGAVINDYADIPPEKINNHYYWAAAAVGATAIAIQDRGLLDWSIQAYRASVRDIDAEGLLPRELARKSRAFSYHVFALQPLMMLAEIGRVNGIDLYAEDGCAICRLATRVTNSINDPAYFEARTGTPQVMEEGADGRALIWVEILSRACPDDARLKALHTRYQPFSGRRLGGNLTDVYQHIHKELPNAVESKACSHLWR